VSCSPCKINTRIDETEVEGHGQDGYVGEVGPEKYDGTWKRQTDNYRKRPRRDMTKRVDNNTQLIGVRSAITMGGNVKMTI